MVTRVFLGNAPWSKPGFYGVRAGSQWPHFEAAKNSYMPFPFQLAYAAALLERQNAEVLLVDGIAERMSDGAFQDGIMSFGPDVVLLEVSTPSIDADLRTARRLKTVLPPGAKLAFAGPHAPMFSPDFLVENREVDIILQGEYELTLSNLVEAMGNGTGLQRVPGLLFRGSNEGIESTGPPQIIEDIDSLPWPARHFLPMSNYFDNPGNIPEPALQMWGSRGCPYSCSFCIWPQLMNGNRYRPRSVSAILDEIEHEARAFGCRSVYFDDDTFNIGKVRMLEFCREKIRRGLDIPWAIMARADLMDREILEAMSAANLQAVKYGIESADAQLLANVNKRLDIDKAVENVRLTKQMGIMVHLTFMFGIPQETRATIRKSVRLAKKLNPDSVQFSLLTPLPGTRIYDELLAKGHLSADDWRKYDGYHTAVIRTDSLDANDLEAELAWAWRSWFRHRALSNSIFKDAARLVRILPRCLRHPRSALGQIKNLLRV